VDTLAEGCEGTGAYLPPRTGKKGLSAKLTTGPFASSLERLFKFKTISAFGFCLIFLSQIMRVQVTNDQINSVDAAS